MKIAISSESSVDLDKVLLEKYDIHVIPYQILLGDRVETDGQISPEEVFDYAQKSKILPKTSALNTEEYKSFFKGLLEKYDKVVHLSLSSGISSTFNNALSASQELENVIVIDSHSLSTGIGFMAIRLREMLNDGQSLEEAIENVKNMKMQVSALISKLDFMYKGGRCSSLVFFGANLLKLKPRIIVENGKVKNSHVYRGKMEKAFKDYVSDTLKEFPANKKLVSITFTTASEEMKNFAKQLCEEAGFEEIIFEQAGATVSCHCGENCIGIMYQCL